MSRPYSNSGTITLIPNSFTNTGSYHFTQGTTANSYTNSSSTSVNQMTLASRSNGTRVSEIFFNFDTDDLLNIPSSATIGSVTVKVKYSVSSTSTVSAVSVRMYSGSLTKGSATTTRDTSASVYTLSAGTWTLDELKEAKLYISATHARGTTSATFNFYGADISFTWSVSGTEYEVSISNSSSSVTSDPSTTQYIFQGNNQTVSLYNITDLSKVSITDNNVDISSSLVYIPTNNADVLNPHSFSGSNGTVADQNNGLSGTDSNTYAQLRLQSGTYLEYSFDTSGIPSNATIVSVTCQAKGCVTRSSNAATVQLYSGSTAKGSTTNLSYSSNVTTITLTCGSWTRKSQ